METSSTHVDLPTPEMIFPPAEPAPAEDGLRPAACCEGCAEAQKNTVPAPAEESVPAGKPAPSLVYALGEIGYEFRSEARRDVFAQAMGGNPDDPRQLLEHLGAHPEDTPGVTWLLLQDATPIYVLRPDGPYTHIAYERVTGFLRAQLAGEIERVSIPGRRRAEMTLRSGGTVSALAPDSGGMAGWSTATLVKAVLGAKADKEAGRAERLEGFLHRVYYELRNQGAGSPERAMNFAATNAFQAGEVFAAAAASELELDTIEVVPSPVCRPDSDCWDVQLTFFDPRRRMEVARRVYRFTIDVSDVRPVTVGATRNWSIY